jgi:hypothetical protein
VISNSLDGTIKIWDFVSARDLINEKVVNQWLADNGEINSFHLDNLKFKVKDFIPHLYRVDTTPAIDWPQDHIFYWLRSAENGNSEAMLQLGIIYHRASKKQEAKKWYTKALDAGHTEAKKRLEILELTLPN